MRFRPCIDLHQGKVKQIVGSTLSDDNQAALQVNFSSSQPPAFYAGMYRRDQLRGGHVIMLGPGSEEAAQEALEAWPGGLQVGGGICIDNARQWLDLGASHIIVTSWVFHNGILDQERLAQLVRLVGRERLVLDLSCRRQGEHYYVVTDRWQRFTSLEVNAEVLTGLADSCAEFLVHAVDVEGKGMGLDPELLELLASHSPIPTTYAGGIASMADIRLIQSAGQGRIDYTVGSALDIFGGTGLGYQQLVDLHEHTP
ncbi:phosphoribosylformimino-5-aminoimidazole carboxamide ribotide isomerase [Desulfogranum mediterraneum]|uniref:phosphoribosylformimino-5-aminoimidazole carboxamide ribotide isomerase n=1 Tax=Desulfogranum mediterraneum TaxID=160661 RepID=UPI000422C788|nr:phosphoribosylformimino-5-aminoimidazole carboxamide ribotide isomerase [Desulfogranum mediterraneum]